MTISLNCLLCKSETKLFYQDKDKRYYKCSNCSSVMLDPNDYLSSEEEQKRYENHNNDIHDIRYQNFVEPIVKSVEENYTQKNLGLDFGAGTGPVITSLLEKEGYKVNLYDPFFHNLPENLNEKYDYIICSEVMEHFHYPYKEFKKLSDMLNPQGSIICMTSLYDETIDFDSWYYKNDDTHVFFYHQNALEWIRITFDFVSVRTDKKLIKFTKK